MELPPPYHMMEQPPPPYHSLDLTNLTLVPANDTVASFCPSSQLLAPPKNVAFLSGSGKRTADVMGASNQTDESTFSGEALMNYQSDSVNFVLPSKLDLPTLPPSYVTLDSSSAAYRDIIYGSSRNVEASVGDVSNSLSTKTLSYLDSSSSHNVAGLPFPAKVSPSDVDIGIVTPSGSSISSHADFRPTFLDILPIDDIIMTNILPYLPLQSLFSLRGTCTRARDIITTYFRQSTSLELSLFGSKFTPLAFSIVTRDVRKLKNIFVANAKQWLTDDLLVPVIKKNPKLEVADFSACSTISNKTVHTLAVISGNRLTRLVLRDCHWLSADAVVNLAVKCRKLRHVDLAGCWDVADDAVVTLVSTNGAHLESLSVAKIYGITDKAGCAIARLCRKLTRLNLLGCWRVTDKSVKALAETCPTLKQLFISENQNVTEATLAPLRRLKVEIDVPAPGGPGGGGVVRGGMFRGLFQQRGVPQDFGNIPPPAFMAAVSDNPVRPRFHRL